MSEVRAKVFTPAWTTRTATTITPATSRSAVGGAEAVRMPARSSEMTEARVWIFFGKTRQSISNELKWLPSTRP
jgi:hypothetical protein